MKKRIFALTFFLITFSTFAQQDTLPTVEEIYAKYIEAIGGSEKLNSIETRKKVSSVFIEYEHKINGQNTDQRITRRQDLISFFDYKNRQHALLGKNYPYADRDTIVFVKQLTANGKTITMDANGKREKETKEAVTDNFKGGSFPETAIHPGSEVLPNEMFNNKKVYVIHYEYTIGEIEKDHYIYFDIDSDLLVGKREKVINHKYDLIGEGISSTQITEYDDYEEVEGVLIPYMIKFKKEVISITNANITNQLIKVIDVEFNVDIKDFKDNCFQQPEICFKKYIKN